MILRALLALLLLAPAAAAGTADAPESSDPAGDAGPLGTPAPGHEDLDLVAVWFENEDLDSVDLVLKTAGALKPRPSSWVWYAQVTVKGGEYFAGTWAWNTIQTGYWFCRDGGDCSDIEWAREGDMVRFIIPKAAIDNATLGDTLALQGAWTAGCANAFVPGTQIFLGQCSDFDIAPAGTPFVLAKGVLAEVDNGTAAANSTLGAAATEDHSQHNMAQNNDMATPGPAVLAVLAASALAVLAARRR